MNLISIKLQVFLGESLSPEHFIGFQLTPIEIDSWNTFLEGEVAGIKRRAANWCAAGSEKRQLEMVRNINQLVVLSNVVHSFLHKYLAAWRNHKQASQIKAQYLHTCQLLEDLITHLTGFYPSTKQHVRITNYFLPQIKMALRHKYSLLIKHLEESTIDTELSELFVFAVGQIINQAELTSRTTAYIDALMDLALKQHELDTRRLQHFLMVNDFNVPEFFHYYIGKWRVGLTELPGLHEQQEFILKEKDLLFNIHLEKGLTMPVDASILYDDLTNFLSEKYRHLKELVKIRRQALRDSKINTNWPRVLIDLPVPQFGLFIRMQIEKGWFGKEHIGELFTFFAKHFYTPHAFHMSPESLQKKSTDVEFSTAQKMKGHLIGMINWLNTHYNLSNYN